MGAVATCGAVLGLALLCTTPQGAAAGDGPPRRLHPRVERVLRWLPEDTETVFVARSVTLTELNPDPTPSWQDIGVSLASSDLHLVDDGRYAKRLLGRKVDCIVSGARNFEGVSKSGPRSECCSIIIFDAALGDAAREWTEDLRQGAKAVRTIAGREVFVFPSPASKGAYVEAKEWQGAYFVYLRPDTVLCASSDRYLETVLRRSEEAPGGRALPDDLPEWGHVDFDAPVWMLRHIPKVGKRGRTIGLTAAFVGRSARVVFVPKVGSAFDRDYFRAIWLPEGGFGDELADRVRIERRQDGTVEVRCANGTKEVINFYIILNFYYVQALGFNGEF